MEKEIKDLALRCCANITGASTSMPDLKNVKFITNAEWDVLGFTAQYKDAFVVAFQGSDSDIDWFKVNFRIWHKVVPYNRIKRNIKIHEGFISAYMSIREELLKSRKNSGLKKVYCFGHSLGGAMATLASLDIQYNSPDSEIGVVTFGSPRVGNYAFRRSFNHRVPNYLRYVFGNDTVPYIPPAFFGFSHVGQLKKIGPKRHWWKFWKISDHMIPMYMSASSEL
jgi:hypothetical protein